MTDVVPNPKDDPHDDSRRDYRLRAVTSFLSGEAPLPPVVRRINETAQFLGSLSLFFAAVVAGYFFFFGSPDITGYRFDATHGWALLGQQGKQEAFIWEMLPTDPAPRIEKGVKVRKSAGGVFLRPEPIYPFWAVVRGWLGFDRDAGTKGFVQSGTCAVVNGITNSGFSEVWIHVSIIDEKECGGPKPEPPPPAPEPEPAPAPVVMELKVPVETPAEKAAGETEVHEAPANE